MLKIEDVKVSDELVCISPEFFKDKSLNENAMNYLNEPMRVLVVDESIILTNDENFHLTVFPHELKHFKKKEQPQYTFDDLIDVAVQAVKDGLIACDDFKCHSISFCVAWDEDEGYELASHHDAKYFNEAINFIQFLYKKTFVIECEEDLKRVNPNPKITLNNGEVIPFTFKETAKDHLIFYDQACGHNFIPFVFLKGATVEQERGRDDRS